MDRGYAPFLFHIHSKRPFEREDRGQNGMKQAVWVLEAGLEKLAWGPATIVLLLGTGIYLTVRTGFFQLTHLKMWIRETVGRILKGNSDSGKGMSPFQSACTALAATLGTGNIAGVATALAAGGPGALFWMWVSALAGTMTAYAENVLAGLYRGTNRKGEPIGGAMFYIEKGLHSRGLALFFALLCILGSLGMGNMAQANSIAAGLWDSFSIPPAVTGFAAALLVAFVMLGGAKRIGQMAEKLVPVMALGYAAGAFAILLVHWEQIPGVITLIVKEAFSFKAGVGGVAGFGVARALRVGIARGVCSNEAGLGSSVMANSAAGMEPVQQGMWGIFEVAVDTLGMCMLTGLAILCSGAFDPQAYAEQLANPGSSVLPNGAALTANAFRQVLGPLGGVFVALSLALFAFSTLLGWSYYGSLAAGYLGGRTGEIIYKGIYIILIFVGSFAQLELVWGLSDAFNGLMALPNLLAVLCLSPQVLSETKRVLKGTKHTK